MESKISGVALAEKHKQALIERVNQLKAKMGEEKIHFYPPTIASFCNIDDPASVRYTDMKKKKAAEIGIDFWIESYNIQTPQEHLRDRIREFNERDRVDGIMVQLPLPIDLIVFRDDLLNMIKPEKDVDGLTEEGQRIYMPATVKSVISILESEIPEWTEMQIGVVGSEGEVGRPLVQILNSKFKVQNLKQVDRTDGDINKDLKQCDVVISCVGKEGLIKPQMLKDGVVLIDVGLGDFDEGCFEKASKYTGKFGGVGPMTVISLMENVVESFSNR